MSLNSNVSMRDCTDEREEDLKIARIKLDLVSRSVVPSYLAQVCRGS